MFSFEQPLRQLEARKGGYFYLVVPAEVVEQFPRKRKTRLICTVDDSLTYRCGLNHLGDGNFFLILSGKRVEKLKKELGEELRFSIHEDPDPLGVPVPEVLQVLIAQDELARQRYEALTDGKKRSLIFSIQKIKDLDLQVSKTLAFLEETARAAALKKKTS